MDDGLGECGLDWNGAAAASSAPTQRLRLLPSWMTHTLPSIHLPRQTAVHLFSWHRQTLHDNSIGPKAKHHDLRYAITLRKASFVALCAVLDTCWSLRRSIKCPGSKQALYKDQFMTSQEEPFVGTAPDTDCLWWPLQQKACTAVYCCLSNKHAL